MQYALTAFFRQHPATGYLIAFSGGLDSHVLLHACALLRKTQPHLPFRALHIDHGLQAGSAAWAEHCRHICQALDVPFTHECLNLQVPAGESVEAVARTARYAVFSRHLQAGEMLLTAHHQNDQAETLLLHLIRGSGVDGLAAMPECRAFAAGRLGRPLLGLGRAELAAYAHGHALDHLHDPSNAELRFDRNFLRHQVLPLLAGRWPAVLKTLARAAHLQGESRTLLEGFLHEKLPSVQGSQPGTLSVRRLQALDIGLRKALLRAWLVQQGFGRPEEKTLLQVLDEVLAARADAGPCVRWAGCEIRRYRDGLYALEPLLPHDPGRVLHWDVRQALAIPSLNCTLQPEQLGGWLNHLRKSPAAVTVRFRQGGESVYLPSRGGHHSLKHLLQEAAVVPWMRGRVPLVYVGERLVSIPGILYVEPYEITG